MVSMKDIAKRCGVSVATVSKALNNSTDISAARKLEIQQEAEKMGYYPNSSARALKTKRTYNLGILFVDEAGGGLTHDYFSHVLDSFKRTAESRGYDITFSSENIGNRKLNYYQHCKYRGFDGVVIACIDFYEPEILELIHSELPVVLIDHIFDNRIAILSDNVAGMKDLLTHIYKQGHRKISYIHGKDSSVTRQRLSSFYRTAEELELVIPDEYVREAAYHDTLAAKEITSELLRLSNPPTCILYQDDVSSLGGISAIREKNLKIPEDISVAGYDGATIAKIIEPKLTTISQDTKMIGKLAAEKLINLIENPRSTLVEQVLVKGKLLIGNSVKSI